MPYSTYSSSIVVVFVGSSSIRGNSSIRGSISIRGSSSSIRIRGSSSIRGSCSIRGSSSSIPIQLHPLQQCLSVFETVCSNPQHGTSSY